MFVNKISFGSKIVRNDLFNWGVEQANDDAKDFRQNANAFVNAVNYLRNDGKNDVYTVSKERNPNRPLSILLLKNGEPVKRSSGNNGGEQVEDVFISYVKDDLCVDVNKPMTKALKQETMINELANSLYNTQQLLSEDIKKLNDIKKLSEEQKTIEIRDKVKDMNNSIAYRI